jgi:hypothetical protein
MTLKLCKKCNFAVTYNDEQICDVCLAVEANRNELDNEEFYSWRGESTAAEDADIEDLTDI